MITDALLRVSQDQSVTVSAPSTYSIDLGVARDVGEGKPLYMLFTVTTTFAGLTSLAMSVATDDNAAMSSVSLIASTPAILLANLKAGAQFALVIPPQLRSMAERYLGAYYTVVGTATAGKITTDIVETLQDGAKFYASGFVIK